MLFPNLRKEKTLALKNTYYQFIEDQKYWAPGHTPKIKEFGKNRSDVWCSRKCSTVEVLTIPLITSTLGLVFLIYIMGMTLSTLQSFRVVVKFKRIKYTRIFSLYYTMQQKYEHIFYLHKDLFKDYLITLGMDLQNQLNGITVVHNVQYVYIVLEGKYFRIL